KGCVSSIVVLPVAEGLGLVITTPGGSNPFPRIFKATRRDNCFTSLFGGSTRRGSHHDMPSLNCNMFHQTVT
ncbi:MAG: hypothetical protein K0S92_1706, partial [Desertimonas sp.]|nr:hypothetical protein [Desertimonas sp.]